MVGGNSLARAQEQENSCIQTVIKEWRYNREKFSQLLIAVGLAENEAIARKCYNSGREAFEQIGRSSEAWPDQSCPAADEEHCRGKLLEASLRATLQLAITPCPLIPGGA
jgi:hypothetical protein